MHSWEARKKNSKWKLYSFEEIYVSAKRTFPLGMQLNLFVSESCIKVIGSFSINLILKKMKGFCVSQKTRI